MSKDYDYWLDVAAEYKTKLDASYKEDITERDTKDIIYFRGKYLYALKQAHKINPTGVVPPSITGVSRDLPINYVIGKELANHQAQIQASLNYTKKNPTVKEKIFGFQETNLNFRRLLTRISQKNFSNNNIEKKSASKKIGKDALDLGIAPIKHAVWTAGKAAKYSVLATSKAMTVLGPLTIKLFAFPYKIFNFLLVEAIDICNGPPSKSPGYNQTFVAQLSSSLEKGVKEVFESIYKTVQKI